MEEKDEIEQDVEEEEEFDEEGEETGAQRRRSREKEEKAEEEKKKKKSGPAEAVCLYPGGQLFDIVQGGGSGDADSGAAARSPKSGASTRGHWSSTRSRTALSSRRRTRGSTAPPAAPSCSAGRGQPPLEPSPTKGLDASAYEGGVVPGTTTETGGVKLAVYCSAACKAQHAPSTPSRSRASRSCAPSV